MCCVLCGGAGEVTVEGGVMSHWNQLHTHTPLTTITLICVCVCVCVCVCFMKGYTKGIGVGDDCQPHLLPNSNGMLSSYSRIIFVCV